MYKNIFPDTDICSGTTCYIVIWFCPSLKKTKRRSEKEEGKKEIL